MTEQHATPLNMERLVTTAELARFETCRLAWWYDRTHPLARATPPEIARRLDLFEAVYGPGVRDLPEYQLLTHLRAQAQDNPAPPSHRPPSSPVLPTDKPRRLAGYVLFVTFALIVMVLAGVFLAALRL